MSRLLRTVSGMDWWLIIDVAMALGVTIRLTRAITVEEIGARLLRHPVEDWAGRIPKGRTADLDEPFMRRRWFWADALSCPFCVSTWIGIGAFATMAIAHSTDSWFTVLWRVVAAGLAASYVVAHLLVAAGDMGDVDDAPEYDDETERTGAERTEPEQPATTGTQQLMT